MTQNEVSGMKILFICSGNTCRSPVAEGLFNLLAQRQGLDAVAGSAGLFAAEGEEANPNAVRAAAELGADISGHNAKQVTVEQIKIADSIFTMTRSQAASLKSALPLYADKISPIGESDVSDPFGGGIDTYRQTAVEIKNLIENIISELRE